MEKNMYDNPEKFGLKLVGMVDIGGSYEFDMFVVFKDGRKFCYAKDAGCSCPTPFEGQTKDDLTYGSKAEVVKALKEFAKLPEDSYSSREGRQDDIDAAVVELISRMA